MSVKKLVLKSGYQIPLLGFGTYRLTGKECTRAVSEALNTGYVHIDTAVAYDNEEAVAHGIDDSGVNRSNIFITTKISRVGLQYGKVIEQCKSSLEKLQTDYIDLLLIHWPNSSIPIGETLDALHDLTEQKMIRSAGVSNFTIKHLKEALALNKLPICNNQVEYHPLLNQRELYEYCGQQKIVLTAYSPIARGKVSHHQVIQNLAERKDISAQQLSLAWLMQKQIVSIPKASTPEHINENYQSQFIDLTPEEMSLMEECNRDERLVNPPWAEF